MSGAKKLATLLVEHRPRLLRYVEQKAARLLRFETSEDLVQGVHLRALDRAGSYRHESEERFLGWLMTVAQSFLADRHVHWSALKRRSGRLLRITMSPGATSDPRAVGEPQRTITGPATRAERREQLTLAVKALAILMPRDRQLVGWHVDGLAIADQAQRLDVSYAAAQKAHHRALERFRKAFTLLAERG